MEKNNVEEEQMVTVTISVQEINKTVKSILDNHKDTMYGMRGAHHDLGLLRMLFQSQPNVLAQFDSYVKRVEQKIKKELEDEEQRRRDEGKRLCAAQDAHFDIFFCVKSDEQIVEWLQHNIHSEFDTQSICEIATDGINPYPFVNRVVTRLTTGPPNDEKIKKWKDVIKRIVQEC